MAIYFRGWAEIDQRTTFDPSCGISPDDLASLIGEYHVPGEEERPCQAMKDGKRCEEPHKNGWLGRRRQDDREALIGQDCGIKYFRASAIFRSERNRLHREINLESYLKQLEQTAGNPEYRAELERTRARLRAVREDTKELQEMLPASIVRRLAEMSRANDPSVVVEFRYDDVEEDDDGKPIVTWEPEQIGRVLGLEIWDDKNFRPIFATLNEIRVAMSEAQISRDAGDRKLKRWADKLTELSPTAAKVVDLERAFEAFTTPENLQLVCFTVANQTDGVRVVSLAMERVNEAATKEARPQSVYNELRARISERRSGRSFRIR